MKQLKLTSREESVLFWTWSGLGAAACGAFIAHRPAIFLGVWLAMMFCWLIKMLSIPKDKMWFLWVRKK